MGDWGEAYWPALSPLLDRALDLDAAARAAFIGQVRAGNPQLGDALERMLAEHARVLACGFLENTLDLE